MDKDEYLLLEGYEVYNCVGCSKLVCAHCAKTLKRKSHGRIISYQCYSIIICDNTRCDEVSKDNIHSQDEMFKEIPNNGYAINTTLIYNIETLDLYNALIKKPFDRHTNKIQLVKFPLYSPDEDI